MSAAPLTAFSQAMHKLRVLKAPHFVGWQGNMVGPSATEVGARDLTLAARHRRRTAISFFASCLNSFAG
jgi:hypothetical protein